MQWSSHFLGSSGADHALAVIANEINWVETHAKPRIDWVRSTGVPEPPDGFLSLLKRALLLAPQMTPPEAAGQEQTTISHPDLHLDNIMVDPKTGKILSVIHWQSSCVSELYYQRDLPPLLPHASSSFSVENAEHVATSHLNPNYKATPPVLQHYIDLTRERNPRRSGALCDALRTTRKKPLELVTGAWVRDDVFSFRHALIAFVARWNELVPGSGPCPVDFTEAESEDHLFELDLMDALRGVLHRAQDQHQFPIGGMVQADDFERCRFLNKRFKENFVSIDSNDLERAVLSNIWPYQDDDERGEGNGSLGRIVAEADDAERRGLEGNANARDAVS